jgi:hypothetical protein
LPLKEGDKVKTTFWGWFRESLGLIGGGLDMVYHLGYFYVMCCMCGDNDHCRHWHMSTWHKRHNNKCNNVMLIINLKQNKENIHANKVKERKPMHDDNIVWMKQIKKLRKEREYTCKAQRKKSELATCRL